MRRARFPKWALGGDVWAEAGNCELVEAWFVVELCSADVDVETASRCREQNIMGFHCIVNTYTVWGTSGCDVDIQLGKN